MSKFANTLGFLSQKAYVTQQSGVPKRANDCRALNPSSQEN
jgi:hypothetical protein